MDSGDKPHSETWVPFSAGEVDSGSAEPGSELEVPPNRRLHPRFEIDTEIVAILSSMDRDQMMRGRSLDISEAGIAGVFVTGWEIGTPVILEFSVPVSSTAIQVEAVVRNRAGYRYGFEFVNLSGEHRELISRTCRVLALLG